MCGVRSARSGAREEDRSKDIAAWAVSDDGLDGDER